MIVWVASYPRSGNRLCRATLKQVFGVRTGSAASEDDLRSSITEHFGRLGARPDDDRIQRLQQHGERIFLKTHGLPQHVQWAPDGVRSVAQREKEEGVPTRTEDSPALYLVRDGRDCLVSFAHYLKDVAEWPEFQTVSLEEAIAGLMRGTAPFGGWSGHVGAWRRRAAPTAIVRFEDLLEEPITALRDGAAELGIDLPEPKREPISFGEMRSNSLNPKLVRHGKSGSWRSEFPPHLLDEFWELHGEQMEGLGYPRTVLACGGSPAIATVASGGPPNQKGTRMNDSSNGGSDAEVREALEKTNQALRRLVKGLQKEGDDAVSTKLQSLIRQSRRQIRENRGVLGMPEAGGKTAGDV